MKVASVYFSCCQLLLRLYKHRAIRRYIQRTRKFVKFAVYLNRMAILFRDISWCRNMAMPFQQRPVRRFINCKTMRLLHLEDICHEDSGQLESSEDSNKIFSKGIKSTSSFQLLQSVVMSKRCVSFYLSANHTRYCNKQISVEMVAFKSGAEENGF